MRVRLADKVVEIETLYEKTQRLIRAYRCEGEAELCLSTNQADIDAERARSGGLERPDDYFEMAAVQRKLSRWLLSQDVLLFHGSALSMDGKGYIFTAPSGTGKSTHARLWRERFGERVTMVNDDKPFLKIEKERVLIYGSPWSGKHRLDANISVPLHGLALLERAEQNSIERVSPTEAVTKLLQQSYRDEDMEQIFPLVLKLAELTPICRLRCNMDPEAAEVAYKGMVLNELPLSS